MKMKPIIKLMCVALFLLFSILAPLGVNAEGGVTLTLDQAVDAALKHNSQMISARNNLEKAKLAVRLEVLKTYPQATIGDSFGASLDTGDSAYTLTITIKETLPTKFNLYGHKIPTNIETAMWDQFSTESQLKITAANTINNTINLYLNALKAQKNVTLQESMVKNSRTALVIAQEQLKQGQITKPTELKTENDLANAEYNLEKSKSDYNIGLQQLGNQIGMEDMSGVALGEVSFDQIPSALDLEQLKQAATQKRLELGQARVNTQKVERQLAQQQNQGLPDLNAGYSHVEDDGNLSFSVGYGFLSGNVSGDLKSVSGSSARDPNNPNKPGDTLSLNLTWTIDFGTVKNQVQQTKLALENAQNSEKDTLQGILSDLEQAYANFSFALKKVQLNQTAIPYYQKQLEIKQLEVKIGTATPLDLAKTQTDLLQATIQLVNSQYDLLAAYEKVQLTAGELYPQTENI